MRTRLIITEIPNFESLPFPEQNIVRFPKISKKRSTSVISEIVLEPLHYTADGNGGSLRF